MNSKKSAPDEMGYCDAIAAPIGSSDRPLAVIGNGRQSERLLHELGQFIQRVSVHGIENPIDRALLEGAKQIFESLKKVCDDISKEDLMSPSDETAMLMSVAGYGDLRDAGMKLDAAGPDDLGTTVPTAPKRAAGRPARKKTAKKKAGKKTR